MHFSLNLCELQHIFPQIAGSAHLGSLPPSANSGKTLTDVMRRPSSFIIVTPIESPPELSWVEVIDVICSRQGLCTPRTERLPEDRARGQSRGPSHRCFDPNFFYLNFTRIAPLLGNILWQMGPGRLGPAKMSKFSRAQCTGTQSARAWFSRGSICQKKKSPLGSVCLDPFSKWRGFKLRYWFLSWCLPYSFGILFLNLSLSFPIFSLPPFLTNHKMFPLTLHLSMRHPICLFYPRKTFSKLVSFTVKLILVVDWFYFKYTVFRSTLHGSLDNADQE